MGYSMGGIIAQNFIARHPDRVLTGTVGGMSWFKAGGFAQFRDLIGRDDANGRPVAVCARSLSKLALTEEEIKSIRVPMTVLIGENDRLVPKQSLEALTAARPDWPVVEIKDANHLTCVVKLFTVSNRTGQPV